MLASPIKWVGGKSRLRKQVIDRLPKNVECYIEVFGGAAWVLFGKQRHPVEVLNDSDRMLITLWQVLKWRPSELLEEIHKHLYSRSWFYELRENPPKNGTELEQAVWMYLMIQMAFGADLSRSQSLRFGFRNKSPRDLFLNKSLEQIDSAAERLRGVFIECLDFADVIRRYDQPRSIFFCDPPYLKQAGYAESFCRADHERLAHTLRSIEGRFLLTVNDCPETREIYSGWYLEEAQESRALARDSKGRVSAPILFISNYSMGEAMLMPQQLKSPTLFDYIS